MNRLTFNANSQEAEQLQKWWEGLEDDRGTRALLRRCATLEEAALAPGTQHLCQALGGGFHDLLKIGAIAALTSQVKHLRAGGLAQAFASGEGRPALSELRFQRLIQCQDLRDLFPLLRRSLSLVDRAVNLQDLAHSIWFWNDKMRREWTFAYYQNLSSTPHA